MLLFCDKSALMDTIDLFHLTSPFHALSQARGKSPDSIPKEGLA